MVVMEFKLKECHRDVSDKELLDDLRRVAELLSKENLSMLEYQKNGKYHPSTIARRFGGWRKSLKNAGLSLKKNWATYEYCDDETMFFEDMRVVASKLDKEYITTGDYVKHGKYSKKTMLHRYGSWDVILQKAGLKPTPYRLGKGKTISDEELFQDIERVWIKLGRQPTITDVKNGEFSFGQNTFARHFGGWRGALEAFIKYVNSDDNEVSPPSNNSEQQAKVETRVNQHKQSNPIEREEKVADGPKNHKTNRDINLRLRFKVMARDNFKCCMCGRSPATDPSVVLHIDHIKPWAKGGETTMDNLQTLCSKCNLGKSDIML